MMMFKGINDIYTPNERTVDNVKIGDVIELRKNGKSIKYNVVAVYPYHVRAEHDEYNGIFISRCFTIGELVKLGVEPGRGENCKTSNVHNSDYDEV